MKKNGFLILVGFTLIFLFWVFAVPVIPGNAVETAQKVTLQIGGMKCESCVKEIRKALLRVPGVKEAEVDFGHGMAIVKIGAKKVTDHQLVKAVESASNAMYTYQASVIAEK